MPWHQAEPEPVIDHGKAAGAETETLPECAIDLFAGDNVPVWKPAVGGEPSADSVELAPPQRVKKIAREEHAPPLTPRQAFLDKMLDACRNGCARLCAEAAQRKRCVVLCGQPVIQPGRAGCVDLARDVDVGARHQHQGWRGVPGSAEAPYLDDPA